MSKRKLTQEEVAERNLRKKVMTGQSLSIKEVLFKEVFINSFLSKKIQSEKSKIPLPRTWNIKLYHLINELNVKLKEPGYSNSIDIVRDIFIIKSVYSDQDSHKYAWLSERITEEFKNLIFNPKSEVVHNKVIWSSNRYVFKLDFINRKIDLIMKKGDSVTTYTKHFEIRDLDLYPSMREVIGTMSK